MTYNITNLLNLLSSHSELPVITTALSMLLKSGYKPSSLCASIESFYNIETLPEEYEDDLDDLIAAMQGHCDRDYILHPSHYANLR
ncbi:MAG: hypothetical protein ACI88H_003698 [Cocleimonas sp.]|jgi:hypothetical protein